ncbi:MAG TPA: sigma-70 family RNA polymerase sigma factor [Stellaceae bacterium]|nr:sigma-70 family RNA polymerase sigma factor [Stellaceae bacterium]
MKVKDGGTEHRNRLLRDVAGGDKAAFEELYRLASHNVFRHLASSLADREAARDLTHDTFLEVWRKAATFKGECAALTWILTIATNKLRDHLRRSDGRLIFTDDEARLDSVSEPESQLESLSRSELQRLVQKVLPRLSAVHRQVIDLTSYHNLTVSEIARIMDCPENTVKTRMFFARQRLKALLAEEGVSKDTI